MSDANNKTAMAIVAHADDLEAFAGGLVAKLVDSGYTVHEVIATNNERGSHLLPREELIEVSAAEARAGADILGIDQLELLNYPDGNLMDTPINQLRGEFMELIRKYKPQIVITWDPFAPYETHPDHRHTAWAACEAAGFGNMPLFHPEHKHDPHYVSYMYYFAKHPRDVNRVVNITPVIDRKIAALNAHECQMHLILQDLKTSLDAAGVQWPGGELDYTNYEPVIDMGMRMRGEAAARDMEFQYAEVFRVEAFGGSVEDLGLELPTEPWVD